MDDDIDIRELDSSCKLNKFSSGDAAFQPLKTFLQKQALDFHNGSIAKTYVAVSVLDKDEVNPTAIGYVTVVCSEIALVNAYIVNDCQKANAYDSLPALKIARLAVDAKHRKKDIGKKLVDLVIAIAADVVAPSVGCRFIITDAKREAISFYQKIGFTMLDTDENRSSDTPVMFIDLKTIVTT